MQSTRVTSVTPKEYYVSSSSSSSSSNNNGVQNSNDSKASEAAIIKDLMAKQLKIPNFKGDLATAISIAQQKCERESGQAEVDALYFLAKILEAIFDEKINVEKPSNLFAFLSVDQLNRIGKALRYGDSKASYHVLSWAVKKKSSLAMFNISEQHEKGRGGATESPELAFNFCKAATNPENAPVHTEAYARLAGFFERGYGTPTNMTEAIKYYHLAEETGDMESCFRLAQYYCETGLDLEEGEQRQDFLNKGALYLEKAVGAKFPKAIAYKGNILRVNSEMAAEGLAMLKEAAALGDSQAQLAVANNYFHGFEGRDLRHRSISYFQQCLGGSEYAKAAAMLGKIYSEGELVPRNLDQAITYYSQAVGFNDHSPYWKELVIAKLKKEPQGALSSFKARELAEIYLIYREEPNQWTKARNAINHLMNSHNRLFNFYILTNLLDSDQISAFLEKCKENAELFLTSSQLMRNLIDRIAEANHKTIPQLKVKVSQVALSLDSLINELSPQISLSETGSDESEAALVQQFQEKLKELSCNAKAALVQVEERIAHEKASQERSSSTIINWNMPKSEPEWEIFGIGEAKKVLKAAQDEEQQLKKIASAFKEFPASLDLVLQDARSKGEEIVEAFQSEKAKLFERRQQVQMKQEKKEQTYALLVKREGEVTSELEQFQAEITRCLQSAQSELDAVDLLSDKFESKIQEIEKKYQTALNNFSIEAAKEKMKSQRRDYQSKMQEMQQRAESAETKLLDANSEKYAGTNASARAEREELDLLRKELHEAKKIAAKATHRAARQVEELKIAHASDLEKQRQTSDSLRKENENLRSIVQQIPITTSIEILQSSINRRISELKGRGIKAYKEYNLNNFPPRTYNLDGLEAILFGIGFQKACDANGSHRHYERGAESIGLSPHNSEEADKAQIQQVLNFLLSDLYTS